MSSPKEKEKKRKACNELINKFLTNSNDKLVKIIESLFPFIPDHTSLILNKTYSKIISILSDKSLPEDITNKIIQMILLMIKKSNGCLQEDPYRRIFSDKSFISCIFMHTGLDKKGEFNHQVIELIYNYLFLKEPEFFVQFFLESKKSIYSLMNSLANQSGDDLQAAQLFHSIFVSNPKIFDSLINEVITLIKKFPPHLVVDLMITSTAIKNAISINDFKEFLFKQNKYTLSDVNQIFNLYPPLWQSLLPFQLILKTDPPRRLAFVSWIHDMPPIQKVELPSDLVQEAFNQMLCPQYKFEDIDDMVNSPDYNSYDLFIFSRLFVLTYSNPAHALTKSINFLYDCIISKSNFILSSSIQILINWIVKFDFSVQSNIVYDICEKISIIKDKSIKCLYQILLHFISKKCRVAEMIIRSDIAMRFSEKDIKLIKRSVWEFKNLDDLLNQIPTYEDFDEKGMLNVLDCINEYFGIQVDKKIDFEDNE